MIPRIFSTGLKTSLLALSCSLSAQAVPFADSVADFPAAGDVGVKQNTNGWEYGYHDLTANGSYSTGDFIPFPDNDGTGTSSTDFWTGSSWDWYPGNPPWTFVGATAVHPNGTNNSVEHWAIRRYTIQAGDVTGSEDVSITWDTQKTNTNGGNGVTGLVFHNGVAVDSLTIAHDDTGPNVRQFRVSGVQAGDVVDLAVTPLGLDGVRADNSDGSSNAMMLAIAPAWQPGDVVADSVADFTGAQGARNWQYGYYNKTTDSNDIYDFNTDFTQMPGGVDQPGEKGATQFWTGVNWDWNGGQSVSNPPWTFIGAEGMHPNGTQHPEPNNDEHWAIRRYVVDFDETYDLTGLFEHTNPISSSDGILGLILLNGIEIFGAVSLRDIQSFAMQLALQEGDILDFIVTPGSLGNDVSDGSRMRAILSIADDRIAVPIPSTIALLSSAFIGIGFRRRTQRRTS